MTERHRQTFINRSRWREKIKEQNSWTCQVVTYKKKERQADRQRETDRQTNIHKQTQMEGQEKIVELTRSLSSFGVSVSSVSGQGEEPFLESHVQSSDHAFLRSGM
jgi:hypothetical protein